LLGCTKYLPSALTRTNVSPFSTKKTKYNDEAQISPKDRIANSLSVSFATVPQLIHFFKS